MSRTADYSIQGFIYQFIVTLHKLLVSPEDSELMIEGIIEDIDIIGPIAKEAIQCKYHESKSKFTLSAIYKPVLQMLCHYQKNKDAKIKYRLHAHFPNEPVGSKKELSFTELQQIIASTAAELQTYIKEVKKFKEIESFLPNFEIEFGASLQDAEKAVIVCLSNEGFSTDDSAEIFYPNAIHAIAKLSIQHDEDKRRVRKRDFIELLKAKKKTAISRWTKELQSYDKILKKRRKQLSNVLNVNTNLRAIVLDSSFIADFEAKIPLFIQEYVQKYNSKIKLNQCPIFSLRCEENTLNKIWVVLNEKKIDVERGILAGIFNIQRFLREPIKSMKDGTIEFKVRLCNHDTDFESVLKQSSIDDIILVSENDLSFSDTVRKANIEKIGTTEISEIKYLLSLANSL